MELFLFEKNLPGWQQGANERLDKCPGWESQGSELGVHCERGTVQPQKEQGKRGGGQGHMEQTEALVLSTAQEFIQRGGPGWVPGSCPSVPGAMPTQ